MHGTIVFAFALKRSRVTRLGYLLLVGLGVLGSCTAYGQSQIPLRQLVHKKWTVAEGGPPGPYELTQGANGLLWVATTSGLYKFNGLSFSPYELPPGSTPVRKDAFEILTSSAGEIWLSSHYSGIVRVTGSSVKVYGPQDGLPTGKVLTISEGNGHTMWCIINGHLLHLVAEHWSEEPASSGLPMGEAIGELSDLQGTVWVITRDSSIYLRAAGARQFQKVASLWSPSYIVTALVQGPKGDLWAGLADEAKQSVVLQQIKVDKTKVTLGYSLRCAHEISDLRFDRHGSLWVAGPGLQRISFDGGVGSNQRPHVESLDEAQLTSTETRSLYEDNEGDMWLVTGSGLERFSEPTIIPLYPPRTEYDAIADVASATDGGVWLHSYHSTLDHVGSDGTIRSGPVLETAFNLFEDHEGAVWFNTRRELFRFQDHKLIHVPLPPDQPAEFIQQILADADDDILIVSPTAIWAWKHGLWSRKNYASAKDQAGIVFRDSERSLWLGYITGHIAKVSRNEPDNLQVIPTEKIGRVRSFAETQAGIFAGGNDGMAVLKKGSFTQLHISPELSGTLVSGMIASTNGDLWLNAERGIVHLPEDELQKAIGNSNGYTIQGERFHEGVVQGPGRTIPDSPSAIRDGAGQLWFNTSATVATLNPRLIDRSLPAPILSVSSIMADDHLLTGDLKAPAGSHTLRIQYIGVNLKAPEDVRYKYRLDRVDDAWQEVGARTEAVYTRLRPGQYHFQVLATNGSHQWGTPAEVTFYVLPFFYQTTWFLVLCGFAVAALILLMYRLRIRSISLRLQERAEGRANERIRIARDLHDTLLGGFQGLLLNLHVAAQTVGKDDHSLELFEQALSKADALLAEGRDRVTDMRAESLEDSSLPEALTAFGEQVGRMGVANYSLEIVKPEIELAPTAKDELFYIAREAVSNSLRHAQASKVGVVLTYERRLFTMLCFDDGRGFAEQTPVGNHYGLVGMRERAALIGAEFICSSAPGEGTRILVRLRAQSAYVSQSALSFLAFKH